MNRAIDRYRHEIARIHQNVKRCVADENSCGICPKNLNDDDWCTYEMLPEGLSQLTTPYENRSLCCAFTFDRIKSRNRKKMKFVYELNDSKMDWIVFGGKSVVDDAARSLRNAKRQL